MSLEETNKNGSLTSTKSSSKSKKVISRASYWIYQPFRPLSYGVKKSAKITKRVFVGKRVSLKDRNDGSERSNVSRPFIRQSSGKCERDENKNAIACLTEDNTREEYKTSFRSQGSNENLISEGIDDDVVLLNFDDHLEGGRSVHERILSIVERILRNILLCIVVYMLGVYQPLTFINIDILILISPAIGVAWCTCFLIQFISWWVSDTTRESMINGTNNEECFEGSAVYERSIKDEDVNDRVQQPTIEISDKLITPVTGTQGSAVARCFSDPNLLQSDIIKSEGEKSNNSQLERSTSPGLLKKHDNKSSNNLLSISESKLDENPTGLLEDKNPENTIPGLDSKEIESSLETGKRNILQPQNHPELEDLSIINEVTMERMYPNGEALNISNVYMEGKMLPMIRTSDADVANDKTSNHFKGRKRNFEIQIQFKMREVPDGKLFIGFEMNEAIKLGMIQRAAVNATMNFMRKRNKGLIYNIYGEKERADKCYEKPYISLPLDMCADYFSISKPGEVLPQLGTDLSEDPEVRKTRKNGKLKVDYNTDDTYTFAIWSTYVDFIKWSIVNLPAIRPFSLSSVIGNQNFNISLYVADPSLSKHRVCDINQFSSFEFGHRKKSRIGKAAKIWMETLGSGLDRSAIKTVDSPKGTSSTGDIKDEDTSSSDIDDDDASTDTEQCEEASLENKLNHVANEGTGTLEDLGEGLYLKSGDPIQIRESVLQTNPAYFTGAGGFAVLQSQAASTIVVEKVELEKTQTSGICSQSKLIKNGDTVMISLIEDNQNNTTKSTKHLAIHRGWWLKWVSYLPKTSGYFQIVTHEMEEPIDTGRILQKQRSFEAQSSYVRLGGTFQLRVHHKLGLHVGVRMESSPTFGGRVMGLYRGNQSHQEFEPDDSFSSSKERHLIKPLYLCASLPCANETSGNAEICISSETSDVSQTQASGMPVDLFYVDTPAWLEIMHRRDRSLQLLYLVRMSKSNKGEEATAKVEVSIDGEVNVSDTGKVENSRAASLFSQVRLRTGENLKQALRLGLHLNGNVDDSNLDEEGKDCGIFSDETTNEPHKCNPEDDPSMTLEAGLDFGESSIPNNCTNDTPNPSFHDASCSSVTEMSAADIDSDSSVPSSMGNEQVYNNCLSEDDFEIRKHHLKSPNSPNSSKSLNSPNSPTRSNRRMNWLKVSHRTVKIAGKSVQIAGKGVKKGTVLAGKGVVKSGKIMGRSVRRNRAQNSPPVKEPRHRRRKRKSTGKDHHVAVSKTLKYFKYDHALLDSKNQVMAGQLTAPDQSCRIVSHILSELSLIAMGDTMSKSSQDAASVLSSQLSPVSEFDLWFLKGGSLELGVVPTVDRNSGHLHGECIVARCLWESHWREEVCLLYDMCVAFYAPLSKKPCLMISYINIQQVRLVSALDDINPLTGFPLIAIETASQCHYLAFADEEGRTDFHSKITSAIFICPQESQKEPQTDRFRPSLELTYGENNKWASIISSKKYKKRVVHNTRRMAFDSELFLIDGSQNAERSVGLFVEDLLRQALSFSLQSLNGRQDDFIHFLNCCSRLRMLPLQKLNLSGKEAFCICVNLYHCLLQHSLLLSLCGPPTKKTIEDFMRTNCYNIGGDCFSLAELQIRVIRGNMSRAIHPRPPFVQAPRKSRAHLAYALGEADPRINFVMNTADMTKPSHVPILTPDELDEQLSACSTAFLRKTVSVDLNRKTVTLPKVCEIYLNDFGEDANCCVHYCLQYLDKDTQYQLLEWLNQGSPYIRYHHSCDQFHSCLQLLSDVQD